MPRLLDAVRPLPIITGAGQGMKGVGYEGQKPSTPSTAAGAKDARTVRCNVFPISISPDNLTFSNGNADVVLGPHMIARRSKVFDDEKINEDLPELPYPCPMQKFMPDPPCGRSIHSISDSTQLQPSLYNSRSHKLTPCRLAPTVPQAPTSSGKKSLTPIVHGSPAPMPQKTLHTPTHSSEPNTPCNRASRMLR
jgi:hypothetical protein